jgi:signal transduction histidine kinase
MADSESPDTIVVIDDEYAMRLSCLKILTKSGFRVEVSEDGAQGLAAIARLKPSAVVVDLKMPGLSGIEVISRIHQIDPNIVVIVITGYATIDTAVDAMRAGAYEFLPKPFLPVELRLIVDRGLERRRLVLQSQRLRVEREFIERRFLTFASHQMQTPLVAIHQCLDVLLHLEDTGGTAAQRKEWLNRCLRRTADLLNIIRDWLTLSKVEGNLLATARTKVDVKQVIDAVVESYRDIAGARSITIEATFPESAYFVCGDRNCVTVLFDNLVNNAVKYNKTGGSVTITGEIGAGEVVVRVADTGVGIPEEYKPFLFEQFFRIPEKAGSGIGGTGLGLHIANRILTEMGGLISIQSQPGMGSTFEVHIPAFYEQTSSESGEQHGIREEAHPHCR